MTDPIIPEIEVLPRSRTKPYDDALKQRCFLLWALEADSDIKKTALLMVEHELADARAEEREPRKMPDTDTIRLWMVKDDWRGKRHDLLVRDGTAGELYANAIGRVILRFDRDVTKHGEIINLPLTEPVLDREGNYVGDKPSTAIPTILKALELDYQVGRLLGRPGDGDPEPKFKPRKLPGETAGTPRDPKAMAADQQRRIKEMKQRRQGKT